jgi:small-conductance mechanosensitive channel
MGHHATSRKLIFAVIIEAACVALSFLAPLHAEAQSSAVSKRSNSDAPVTFWNRVITHQRGILAGATPEERSKRASERLAELPLNTSPDEILTRSVKIEDQDGIGFGFKGRLLFFLGTSDLDKESGETLDEASTSALLNMRKALLARSAERTWPVIRTGLLYTFVGFVVLVVLCVALWKAEAAVVGFLQKKENFFSWNVFRFDLVPHIATAFYGLLRLLSWVVTFCLIYLWVALSLRRFPYTEPWGEQAGGYVLQALRELGITIVESLPSLLIVFLIYICMRWLVRMTNVLFDQLATGRISVSWMSADVARATQRIFSAILWIFAISIAYPYIPGSHTDAFKGLSVFFGLVISLGSTGIINQIMSGLFVVYCKALKTGEWVRINDTEGEVLEVGLLAAKIRTMEGKEVTIPNSVLVSTSTMNFTRLGHPDGMIVSSTVTIGYDAPWRQVHALLELAADRTDNLRKSPKPYVLQRQLSDFYVEYTLVAHLEEERLRIETASNLHAAIQDSFNEFGVQIMSPHYMVQPSASMIVPREKWQSPAWTPTVGSPGVRNDPDASEPKR